MTIRIQTEDFDVADEIGALRENSRGMGALVSFVGVVREFNDEAAVKQITLEHYPGMTEKALQAIVEEAGQRWAIIDAVVVHRVGTLKPSDQIVFVAVSSAHRKEAFLACEFIMDYLKTRSPFWKKEQTAAGERWVESRSSDEAAAKRWRPE